MAGSWQGNASKIGQEDGQILTYSVLPVVSMSSPMFTMVDPSMQLFMSLKLIWSLVIDHSDGDFSMFSTVLWITQRVW